MAIAIKAEHVSKEYRLGIINHGMLFKDLKSWWARKRGKEDPYSKIGSQHFDDQADRFWALKDVSLEIKQGDRVGIIGRNGAGKSTLLKILSRITEPTEGSIKIKGRVASLLEVGTGFHPELTGRDNIYLSGAIQGMKRREIDRKIDEIIEFSEIAKFIDTPVKRYSSGMYVRLAFAVAAHLESEILLADEVLAVGDQEFQKKCLGKMEDVSKKEGRTVLFVSHNLGAVLSLCNTGFLLDNGKCINSGPIRTIAMEYLEGVVGSEVHFPEGKALRWARIYQDDDKIILDCEYFDRRKLDIPILSMSFFDNVGNPLFVVNARNYSPIRQDKEMRNRIRIEVSEPKLHDGEYFVSLHFGDSKTDYELYTHCLRIMIQGMAKIKALAHAEHFGYIHPSTVNYYYC